MELRRVLLVEDNPADAQLIEEMLEEIEQSDAAAPRFQVVVADRLASGRARLAQGGIDVVLADLGLPDGDGMDLLVEARRLSPGTPVIRQCPPAKNDSSTCSTTSSWPMITRRI